MQVLPAEQRSRDPRFVQIARDGNQLEAEAPFGRFGTRFASTAAMRAEHRFRVAAAALFLIGCHSHSTYAPPALPPPPPGPVYVPPSAEEETPEVVVGASDDTYEDNDPSALDDFRAALDGHGAWVDDNEYGTVWLPAPQEVGPDFVPYATAGHWLYDDDDYVWASDYPWGWVPFHYGRWVLTAGLGWAWIPGRVYSGASTN